MATDVIMPKLGESITEGTILEWKKSVGASIEKDEALLEKSPDKSGLTVGTLPSITFPLPPSMVIMSPSLI